VHKGDDKNNIVMGSLYHELLDASIVCSKMTSLARRADSSKSSRQLLKTCDWEKLEILLVLSPSLSLSLSLSLSHTHTQRYSSRQKPREDIAEVSLLSREGLDITFLFNDT
jgi:hypothetical protein